jgi:protein-glutamine gamma-glutamyltransferase
MSAAAQAAVIEPRGAIHASHRAPTSEPARAERPLIRTAVFAALGLYGALRWGTMLSPVPVARLLGLLGLAGLLAGPGRVIAARSRLLGAAVAGVAIVAMLPVAGVPLAWIAHVRIAATASGLGQGLAALPRVLVPYAGIDNWVSVAIVLGAGVLLLDSGVMIMFARRPLTEPWRLGAALPLVVLAVLPSTLARPRLPYGHGLLLFALLALWLWGERIRRADAPVALGLAALTGAAAMLGAAALDPHRPWLDVQGLAGRLSSGSVERFDWSQHYGPLRWPRTGREILDVRAARPDYWKAEDLDRFDGYGWSQGDTPLGVAVPPANPAARRRFTQTIQVTLRGMQSTDVIGAGFAKRPQHVPQPSLPGLAPGTWTVPAALQPGDSYLITTYSPQPSSAGLAAAGSDYPAGALAGYRSLELPSTSQPAVGATAVIFPPFHSGQTVQSVTGMVAGDGGPLVGRSPYAPAYRLAHRLATSARTPAAFVHRVMDLLHHGYVYDENPPASAYPLEAFLFGARRGYCQQFSGAMALLLRMGGLPARVAAGFTPGSLDSASRQWIVSDRDAHAWVEVWFPRFGWVRFDPTPAAAPARSATLPLLTGAGSVARSAPRAVTRHRDVTAPAVTASPVSHGRGGPSLALWLGIALAPALLVAGTVARAVSRRRGRDDPLAELERALARSGRPAGAGLTLSRLEQRWRSSADAAAYVRTVRLARFAAAASRPTAAQRRAVRAELRCGLGAGGWLRAWWALPPRLTRTRSGSETPRRGIH